MIQTEFYTRFKWVIKATYIFLGWVVLLTCFAIFTSLETFFTLKVILFVLTALFAAIAIIFFLFLVGIWLRRLSWKRAAVKDMAENQLNYWLTFDDTHISFGADTYNSNVKWEYYKYYKEHGDSIYIFPDSIYHAIFWSKSEIGQENYDRLKQIAEIKLTALNWLD